MNLNFRILVDVSGAVPKKISCHFNRQRRLPIHLELSSFEKEGDSEGDLIKEIKSALCHSIGKIDAFSVTAATINLAKTNDKRSLVLIGLEGEGIDILSGIQKRFCDRLGLVINDSPLSVIVKEDLSEPVANQLCADITRDFKPFSIPVFSIKVYVKSGANSWKQCQV